VNLRPKSFRAKLLLLFVPVLATAQLATWFYVSRSNNEQAHRLIDEELQQAGIAFTRLVAYRNTLLVAGAQTAARDFQIKQLFVTEDNSTLASALESIRLTSGGDLVAAVDLASRPLASTSSAVPSAGLFARLIAQAEADPRPNPSASGFGYFDGRLYSVVIAAVRAPDPIAWLVIGFRIDREFAVELKQLTGIDLSFFDDADRPLASTLPETAVRELATALPRLRPVSGSSEVPLGRDLALVATHHLATGERQFATLALQYSLDEKLAPARETEWLLIRVTTVSLVVAVLFSLGFARQLTRPIVALVGHTHRIARGDYSVRNTAYREDELGRLSAAFDDMARGLDERDRVRDLLDKNVSPEVAAQLMRDGAALGGEEREVTILFADLRGFTTLSEKLTPHDLLTLLNRYLDRMSGAIEAQGGVIDKFIGDAIMALFGAPVVQDGAADRAVAAARAMEHALADLNAELAAEAAAAPAGNLPRGLALGIGINTARVVAGNIGSHRRLNYSVIGDGVNVAARLQALTRTAEYRTNIIVSAATVRAARTPFAPRPLGNVTVKGRAEPVEIFAVEA
jgi:adenylate cyclase